jgi:hypothetical protein
MYKLPPKFITASGVQEPNCVQRINDGAFIPFDPANTDYQAYLAWIEQGNVPEPAEI